jgi:hypothetical protein
MNKIKLLLFVSSISVSFVSIAQKKDKETMINTFFSVLKNGDEQGFVNLFPNAAITKEILVKIMAAADSSGSKMPEEMMNSIFEKLTDSSLTEQYRQQFSKINRKASAKKINWPAASLVSYTADSVRSNEEGIDLAKLSGKIYFTSDTGSYFITYENVIWIDGKGWYGVSVNRIDEKSKELEEEDFDIEPYDMETDSVAMSADTIMVAEPEPPKPVKKTVPAKPAGKPIKTKTPAPARKPGS